MPEKEFQIARLIALSIKGGLTADEETELHAWIAESEQNRERYELWCNEELLAQKIRDYYLVNSDAICQKIERGIDGGVADRKIVRRIWPRVAIAAAVVLAVVIAGMWVWRGSTPAGVARDVQPDILPGSNKAFLVLGNGQRISLTDARNGTIAAEAGGSVRKTADGVIVYDKGNAAGPHPALLYNTVETPRGGQYQVTLSDGSK